DVMIRNAGREILESHGYKTLTAGSGEEAIRILQSLPIELVNGRINQIDLVILDIVMPEMSGIKCYTYLKQIKPELQVIFSTGHNFSEVSDELNTIEHPRIIFKPYRAIDLLTIVRDTLNKSHQDFM
ncbi:MAG: response regulator, partial [Candidatus Sumerlaeia bacterium]|nr:response regulator [Candidatus Sumerlaeia bacterium]